MFVKEIMKNKIVTIDSNKTILDASNIYRENKVGCLIITDKGQVVGIVTERDLIERTICQHRDPENTKIKEIMSSDIKTIDPIDRVEKALDIIKRYKIKKLPVVTGNKLVGIVTITDIAYARPDVKKFLEKWKV